MYQTATGNGTVHTEKSFLNLVNPNQNWIVNTLFREIWHTNWNSDWCQIYRKMVITNLVWSGLTRFRRYFCVCTISVSFMAILWFFYGHAMFCKVLARCAVVAIYRVIQNLPKSIYPKSNGNLPYDPKYT